MMRAELTSIIVAALILWGVPLTKASAEPIVGRATIIDGDTLEIRGERIRLLGVDAPEGKQLCRGVDCQPYRCGQQAANALAERIGETPISCEPSDVDQYGRTIAVCRLGALDLNGWLVEEGFGLAYRRYSTVYVRQEVAAHLARRGIWAGAFEPPWKWRRLARSNGGVRSIDGLAPPLDGCTNDEKQ